MHSLIEMHNHLYGRFIYFYEAKFRKGKMTAGMIEGEIAQVEKTNLRSKKYVFFSRSCFGKIKDENATNLILYALKDLYAREKSK